MSQFTDYDAVCENYANGRVAHGAETLLNEIVKMANKPPKDLHILDAGCGTGNYSEALLRLGVGKISLFDASRGMLKHAEAKLAPYAREKKIGAIKQGCLPTIPYGDAQFDAIMFNCVIHHLDTGLSESGNPFPMISEMIGEVPGGVFTIITQYPEQCQGEWFFNLVPSALHRFLRRFPTLEQLSSMATGRGFPKPEYTTLLGADWFPEYYDAEGPLKKAWRDYESYWSYLSDEELKEALERVKTMKENGTLAKFVRENDGASTLGHFTIVKAKKL